MIKIYTKFSSCISGFSLIVLLSAVESDLRFMRKKISELEVPKKMFLAANATKKKLQKDF